MSNLVLHRRAMKKRFWLITLIVDNICFNTISSDGVGNRWCHLTFWEMFFQHFLFLFIVTKWREYNPVEVRWLSKWSVAVVYFIYSKLYLVSNIACNESKNVFKIKHACNHSKVKRYDFTYNVQCKLSN